MLTILRALGGRAILRRNLAKTPIAVYNAPKFRIGSYRLLINMKTRVIMALLLGGVGVFLSVFQPKNEYACEQVARAELEPRAGFEPATITLPR
jgi:hypothetical protein